MSFQNFIFHFERFRSLILTMGLMLLLLVSCVNDPQPSDIEIPEGMTMVSFLIPDYDGGAAQFGTRAYNPDEEGYMSNLYIVAVKYSDFVEEAKVDDSGMTVVEKPLSTPQVYTYSLNAVGVEFIRGEKKYHQFNVTLYPGKYKFGLIANADLYLARTTKISNFTKEEDFQNIVLNFRGDTPLVPTHLPMVCLPEEIKYSQLDNNGVYSDITSVNRDQPFVEIRKDNSARIFADMKFLCAKVRYTILFDKTPGGISEAFGSSWIRFNVDDQRKPSAHNLRRQTKLLGPDAVLTEDDNVWNENVLFAHQDETAEDQQGVWTINIDRFKWNAEQGADYPKTPDSSLIPWEDSTEEWIKQEQKVWQGIVYLPENLLDNDTSVDDEGFEQEVIQKTYLEFPFHTRVNSLDDTPEVAATTPKRIYLFGNPGEKHYSGSTSSGEYSSLNETKYNGLERNYFYDVVAKVVNPDTDEMEIRVFMSILPWHENDQNIENEGWLNSGSASTTDSYDSEFKVKPNGWIYNESANDW